MACRLRSHRAAPAIVVAVAGLLLCSGANAVSPESYAPELVSLDPKANQDYQQKKQSAAATAQAQHELGLWCRRHAMPEQAEEHFRKALAFDSNHAATRAALGHVRVGLVWLEPSPKAADQADPPADANLPDAEQIEAARLRMRELEQQMIVQIRAEWYRQVDGLRIHYLNSSSSAKARFKRGAETLLKIRDPLAVEPMIAVLSDGTAEQQKLLAKALGQFRTSPATLGLLELALLSEEADVRRLARQLLDHRRDDPRIMPYLLKALKSDDEQVVTNAAKTLGFIGYREAVPALANALTEKETRRVKAERVVSTMRLWFTDVDNGPRRPGEMVRKRTNPWHPNRKKVTVTVFRTEVQEALIAITGENFGFNTEDWLDWYRRNVTRPAQPRKTPAAPNAAKPANGKNP